jgi:large repetitive protein
VSRTIADLCRVRSGAVLPASATRQRWIAVAALALAACGGGDSTSEPEQAGERESAKAIAQPSDGRWSPLIGLSLVPAAAANLPNGKVLFWSAEERFAFSSGARTYTSLFDPVSQTATETLVSNTAHDMFCPGTSNLPDGRLLVSGGISSAATSIYDAAANTWSAAAQMNIPRGYQANCVLEDGSVLTLGGSWSGGVGGKHGEVWSQAQGWRRLTGVPVTSMLSVDPGPENSYSQDSHFWLFPAGNGKVFYAGPGVNMQWIDTRGEGSVSAAGPRGDDVFSINGSAALYDIGKILKAGGAPSYDSVDAHASAYLIDINAGASVRKIAPMAYSRAFHNSVVLPNGQVMVIGGMTYAKTFSDNTSVLRPELFDPASETFTLLPPMAAPRNYHSVALLLPDARVLSAGGGLCGAGCAANHPDLQIYSPHYLFNADGTDAVRPVIASAPAQATHGTRITVGADSVVGAFALIRVSSNTHTVNNDQRRIPLAFTALGNNNYELTIPGNPGIVLPGYYMLFALSPQGVPSIAKTIRISGTGAPTITNPGDQTHALNASVTLPTSATGATSFAASGLPTGLSIDPVSGAISGVVSQAGRFVVTLTATNASAQTSTNLVWTVGTPVVAARYFRLEALSEVAGNPSASMAEFNLLDDNGAVMGRAGWSATSDSAETGNAAASAIDGSASTRWHTPWISVSPPMPHWFSVDIGAPRAVSGFRYLPRNDGSALGILARWRLLSSVDGALWTVLASGNFADLGGPTVEKTVLFNAAGTGNRAPVLPPLADQTRALGQQTSLALNATDADADVLTFVVTGLPPGLSADPVLGVISGAPTVTGVYPVSVQVTDGRGGVASQSFSWTITSTGFAVNPVPAAAAAAGSSVTFTASSNGGAGVTYSWNFGDGSPPTTASPLNTASHAYAAPGLYTVTLTATDSGGTVRTRTFVQAIYAPIGGAARPAQSSTITVENVAGSNARVWLVNQDNDSVSVFDAVTSAKLREIAVGAAPRSVAVAPDGRIWVVNKGSATVSVIDRTSLAVVQTIALPRATMPFGLVFAPDGSAAYVTLEALGQLLKLHPGTGAVTGSAMVGPNPRHLSITAASDSILVSRFISPPLPGEATASVSTQSGGVPRGGEVVVVTAAMVVDRTVVLQHSDRPDSSSQGSGVPNYLAAPVIAPGGGSAWVPSKQDNVKRGVLRNGIGLDFQNTVRAVSSRIDLSAWVEDPVARIDHDNASLASAAVFHPNGAYLFVALQTSRQVAVIDPVSRNELFRFDTGRAPDGLAISADGSRLFVNNFMDRTLGVYDLSRLVNFGEMGALAVMTPNAVASERLIAQVLQGKRLFYDARDPRLARDAYMSCASCHNDGGHDGRVWDMTGFGEGLRNTISLRGRGAGHGRVHWSGNFDEVQDFEGQIRTLAGGNGLMSNADFSIGTRSQPLGDKKGGLSADLDALAAYVASLDTFAQSPYRPAASSLSAIAVEGKLVFARQNCTSCHTSSPFTNSASNTLANVGTIKPSSGSRLGAPLVGLDVPTLRDVWATAPYLHDGSAATLEAAIKAHTGLGIGDADATRLAAYLKEIGSDEGPAPVPGSIGSIWPTIAIPANDTAANDTSAVNLGTKFRSDLSGYITAIRFYKGTTNTGTHVGALWTAAGQQLASVTFANETAAGWQQASLSTPVPITANTPYVVSYHAPNGRYAADVAYFSVAGVDNPPLHALANADSGGNGVYGYGSTLAFPAQTFESTNYWVDVVFTPSVTDMTPPVVSVMTPANGATAVATTSAVTVTFNEAMDAASIGASTIELRNASTSALVAGTVTYNAATRVATLTPAAALSPATTYTASVKGGAIDPRVKDSAGNALASTVSWSFTTVAPDTTPPTLTARSPVDGAAGVPVNSVVTLTFSEAMDAATVGGTTFVLRNAGGNVVAATVAYNAATRVATLTPTGGLAPSSTYTATAVGGSTDPRLKDLAGNALAASSSWSFTSVVADTTPPTIAATTPSSGATGVATSTNVVVTFSEPMDSATIAPGTIELRNTSTSALISAAVIYASATQTATLTPGAALAPATSYTVTVRGGATAPQVKDSAGNALAASSNWSFTTASGPACPCTIWAASATPAVASATDSSSVNLGVKFSADAAGYITGLRFYKGSGNTGTHVGSLWSSSGQLLAQATFSAETASGWQQVNLAVPVAITAGTTYVASYLAPVGRYSFDGGYFNTAGVDRPPLHAPSTVVGAGNGVYLYGAGSVFPSSTYNGGNYWVDVVFTPSVTDTTPPVVSVMTPANGATAVATTSAVTVTFNEAMDAASIGASTIELRNASTSALVAGTVTYNAATRVATLTPAAALSPATTYTASVKGGAIDPRVKDSAGNALASTVSWSFTTVAPDTTPPTLTARSPVDGAAGVPVNSVVTLTFSEAMDAATVGGTTFVLRNAGGNVVAATVAYNAATRVATLTPTGGLAPSSTYTATAVGGSTDPRLKDLAGNALAASSSWSFTSVVADTTPPTIAATTPSSGATGVATSTNVVVTFSEPMDSATIAPGTIELRNTSTSALISAAVIYASATQTATLTPGAALAPATSYTVTVRGGATAPQVKDSAGNALAASSNWSFTTASGPACPCTIWAASATPAVASATDSSSVNLGVKFSADAAGYITGLRFYKGSGNTGTHVGSLWSSSGQLLAQATFSAETASGWQQVNLAVPVAITAGTTYVASYLAPVGRYSFDGGYFNTAGVDRPPLHAPSTVVGAGNGVYLYGAGSVFPSSTYNGANYWVDVVFSQ